MKRGVSLLQTNAKEDLLWRVLEGVSVTGQLEKHHIFGGARRTMSEREGFWVWLTGANHTQSNAQENPLGILGVHGSAAVDVFLKALCQARYEAKHNRAEWMALVGRNYLDEGRPMGAENWTGSTGERLRRAWDDLFEDEGNALPDRQ